MLRWLPSIGGFACWLQLPGRKSQLSVQAQCASCALAAPARRSQRAPVPVRVRGCACVRAFVRARVSCQALRIAIHLGGPISCTHVPMVHHALPRSIDRSCHGNLQLGTKKADREQNRSAKRQLHVLLRMNPPTLIRRDSAPTQLGRLLARSPPATPVI